MLVSVEELRNYMNGITLSVDQQTEAANILQGVQDDLEEYLNRPVELVQVREIVKSDWGGYVNVSVSPVVKVVNYGIAAPNQTVRVLPSGEPYIPPPMERDPIIGLEGRVIDRVGPSWGAPDIVAGGIKVGAVNIEHFVEYVGGIDGNTIKGLKLAIKRVAARDMERNFDDTLSLRQGDAEMANDSDDRPKGWTEDELVSWERYRRRVMA